MKFSADKLQVKELADGTLRIYIDTGEYEYSNLLRQLADMREKLGQEVIYDVEIKGKNQSQQKSGVEDNEYNKLWGLIDSLAKLKGIDKNELEAQLKEEWEIESFTELSDEERAKLEESIRSTIPEAISDRL